MTCRSFFLVVLLVQAGSVTALSIDYEDGVLCRAVCQDSTTVFTRPDSNAVIMGIMSPGEHMDVLARTDDGWLGFDPGVAQAANTGVFRLRWVSPESGLIMDRESSDLPVVWSPEAGVAYAMTYAETSVFAMPDSLSEVVLRIPAESAAGVIGRTPDWYKVDTGIGPVGIDAVGWVMSRDVSVSGALDSLPLLD